LAGRRGFGMQTVQSALDTLFRGSSLHYEILDQRSIGVFSSVYQSAAVKPAMLSSAILAAPAANSVDTDVQFEESAEQAPTSVPPSFSRPLQNLLKNGEERTWADHEK
jgi:hypothetical protein